jgi:subtilisin family serine protease
LNGFPVGVPGVLAVASQGDEVQSPRVLSAPGRDVLTLMPGGRYDYASGSSLATAHVSGAVALLRALDPHLRAEQAQALLERKAGVGAVQPTPWVVDVCASVRQLRADAPCERPNLRD